MCLKISNFLRLGVFGLLGFHGLHGTVPFYASFIKQDCSLPTHGQAQPLSQGHFSRS